MEGSVTPAAAVPAKRPNLRDAAKVRTRAKVMAAAKALFEQPNGYPDATIRKIATAAGMSTGAVFANFTGKDDLWRAVMECEPPVDGPTTRAALPMLSALRGLIAVKPRDAGGAFDSDQVEAWRAAEAAIALAEGRAVERTACAS